MVVNQLEVAQTDTSSQVYDQLDMDSKPVNSICEELELFNRSMDIIYIVNEG